MHFWVYPIYRKPYMDSQWLLSSLLTIWLPSTYPPDPNVFRLHLHRCTKTPQKISAQLSGLVDCYTIHLYPIHLRITLVVNISFFWSLSISYLVGGLNPSWKIWKSMGRIIPHIMENKSHVPNHQPGYVGTSKNLTLLLPSTSQMYQHQPRD